MVDSGPYRAPSFCGECGTPFPWTQAAVDAAKSLTHEQDSLTVDKKTALNEELVLCEYSDVVEDIPGQSARVICFGVTLRTVGARTCRDIRDSTSVPFPLPYCLPRNQAWVRPESEISRLNGWPAPLPCRRFTPSRDTRHGSGPMWLTLLSSHKTCTYCSLPVSRST